MCCYVCEGCNSVVVPTEKKFFVYAFLFMHSSMKHATETDKYQYEVNSR